MKRKFHLFLVLGLSCSLIGCAGTFSPGSITDDTTAENLTKESSGSNILSKNDAELDADESQNVKRGASAESLPQKTPDASDLCSYPVYPGNDTKEADNARNSHQTEDRGNAATINASAPWSLENPPALIVSTEYDVDSVTAEIYGYTWTKKLDEDQMSTIIACGMHPLDDPGEPGYAILYTAFPPGSLPPLPDGQFRSSMMPVFFLDFGEVPPKTVTARRWPAEHVGSASEHYDDAEEVRVDTSEGFLSPLGDGNFVYEIHADWGEVGSADYVFMTLPKIRGGS